MTSFSRLLVRSMLSPPLRPMDSVFLSYRTGRRIAKRRPHRSESSLSGHEAGLGLFSRCPGDDPVHQTRDTSRAVPAHICNGNAGLEHTKALVRNPLCKAGGLSFDVL